MSATIDTRTVSEFVRSWLPSPPATILEVGAGSGDFARELIDVGYDVTPIDPATSDDDLVVPLSLEEIEEERQYMAAVASRTLHHLDDLPAAVTKLHKLVDQDGVIIANDFGWEKLDKPTGRWLYSLLPERASESYTGGEGASFAEWFDGWRTDHDHLRRSDEMLSALRDSFVECHYAECPWLVGEYLERDADLAQTERTLIKEDTIQPLGFRFVGQPVQQS